MGILVKLANTSKSVRKSAGPPLWGAPGCEEKLTFNSDLFNHCKLCWIVMFNYLEDLVQLHCSCSQVAVGTPLGSRRVVGSVGTIYPNHPLFPQPLAPPINTSKFIKISIDVLIVFGGFFESFGLQLGAQNLSKIGSKLASS